MQLVIFLSLLAMMGLSVAAPTIHEANLDTPLSNLLTRSSATDCNECHEHRDLCIKYAVGDKESGCPKVCTSYVCRKWDCRSCGDEFKCDDANLTMPPPRK